MRTVIIIGAGASGLMAAAAAAQAGAQVTVLEHQKKPGRKLLMTGNGRCNLTTLDPDMAGAYLSVDGCESSGNSDLAIPDPGCDPRQVPTRLSHEFARKVFDRFSVQDTLSFFETIGVPCVTDGKLVYPACRQASRVLNALLAECARLKVRLRYDVTISGIRYDDGQAKWEVLTEGWTYRADRLILCCGSQAAPATGSDGSGYRLAKDAGHHITAVSPVLTGILIRDPSLGKVCDGARTKGTVRLLSADEKEISRESGEIQWTSYGLSGIAVFQISRFLAEREWKREIELKLELDLVPDLTEEELKAALMKMDSHTGYTCRPEFLLAGFAGDRVGAWLAGKLNRSKEENISGKAPGKTCIKAPGEAAGVTPGETLGEAAGVISREIQGEAAEIISKETPRDALYERICMLLKTLRLEVKGVRGFANAQAAAGGVSMKEIDADTLESRIKPGLYFSGEICDIDGPCGGYNLQWAWSSGYVAGTAAAQ